MRFTDKPLSFLIDDILKLPIESKHLSLHKHSYCSHARLPFCHLNYPKCFHHRHCRRMRTVFSGN